MRIVLWIGKDSNQKALANKINNRFPIDGIVIEKKKFKRKITFGLLFEKFIEKIFLASIAHAWKFMLNRYENEYPQYPDTKILEVENINSQSVYEFTSQLKPDLILVSGTRLIKENLLSIKPTIGILNLHTGLSPYIKGGPNCTNWCIATEQFHLIGNTVMWIDEGIDSGNIILSDFTSFDGNENLDAIHVNVMEHAHSIYLKALAQVRVGNYTKVDQKGIAEGKVYYNKYWKLKQKIALVKNLKKFRRSIKSNQIDQLKKTIKIVGES